MENYDRRRIPIAIQLKSRAARGQRKRNDNICGVGFHPPTESLSAFRLGLSSSGPTGNDARSESEKLPGRSSRRSEVRLEPNRVR